MLSPLVLVICSLLSSEVAGQALPNQTAPMLVVSVPDGANPTILEVVQRLRGEATSVGFEVLLTQSSAAMPRDRLDALAQARPVAVVTIAAANEPHLLTLSFTVQPSGRSRVEHLTIDGSTEDRADVVVAVRAVDFVRACMMDTLTAAQTQSPSPPPAEEPAPSSRSPARMYVAAGMTILGTSSFSPSVLPRLEIGYLAVRWARIGMVAFGLGTKSTADSKAGQVSLDQRFMGLGLTVRTPPWRRTNAFAGVYAGEFWASVGGQPVAPNVSRGRTLSSPAALVTLGGALALWRSLSLELEGGTLWLENSPDIYGTDDAFLTTVGRPSWQGSIRLGMAF